MPDHEFLTSHAGSRIDHVGTYRRVIPANLTRMYENALDWEHLPHVHASSFSSISIQAAGPWGWRAEVCDAKGRRSVIELRLDKKLRRWITRNLEGRATGAEIWTHVFELSTDELELNIDFFVPDVAGDARDKVGAAYAEAYRLLYDEDVAMMVERQRQLDRRIEGGYSQSAIEIGALDALSLPLSVQFGGRMITLNRGSAGIVAYPSVCPHNAGPLGDAAVENNIIRCPWHGYEFDVITGVCVSGQSCRLNHLPVVRIAQGVVWLERSAQL